MASFAARLRDRWSRPPPADAPSFFVSRWLFLRLLGLIYLAAFVSLWVQIDGLIGSRGILPVADYLTAARRLPSPERYYLVPTLCWLDTSDAFLHGLCAAGVVLSGLLMLGLAPLPVLVGLWACYLSLATAGQDFLGFQWDNLLLETGLLAVFLAPLQLWPRLRREAPSSRAVLWVFRWLLFRLVFMSGIVKLLSRDVTWWNLTALEYHYETQPLPPWTAWYMHQLPGWFQQFSVLVTFALELLVPVLLLLGPRRGRLVACAGIVLLQLLILATGNYGFFNLLAIALCVPVLDDACFPTWLRARLRPVTIPDPPPRPWVWGGRLRAVAVAGLFGLSLLPFLANLGLFRRGPDWLARAYRVVAEFRSVNSYGLFAIMTTQRDEIIVEGSDDGETWLPYEFNWKPGDVDRRPAFVTPHMPRLDWQMWFAALGTVRDNPWFVSFLVRLLQGSPDVLALLERNPFPDKPPRYVRAVLYDYHFTDPATRRATGAWWRRELKGLYCPPVGWRE
jgi:lipase maturation factor 1